MKDVKLSMTAMIVVVLAFVMVAAGPVELFADDPVQPDPELKPCGPSLFYHTEAVEGSTLLNLVFSGTGYMYGNIDPSTGEVIGEAYTSGGAPWYPIRNSIGYVTLSPNQLGISPYAFEGLNVTKLTITPSIVQIQDGTSFKDMAALKTIKANENQYFYVDNGALIYSTNGHDHSTLKVTNNCKSGGGTVKLLTYPRNIEDATYIIPSYVLEIADYAFYGNDKITYLTFSDRVETIGEYAFAGTKIISVATPDSTKVVKSHAFDGCQALMAAYFSDHILTIEADAFANCGSLQMIGFGDFDDSAASISDTAFPHYYDSSDPTKNIAWMEGWHTKSSSAKPADGDHNFIYETSTGQMSGHYVKDRIYVRVNVEGGFVPGTTQWDNTANDDYTLKINGSLKVFSSQNTKMLYVGVNPDSVLMAFGRFTSDSPFKGVIQLINGVPPEEYPWDIAKDHPEYQIGSVIFGDGIGLTGTCTEDVNWRQANYDDGWDGVIGNQLLRATVAEKIYVPSCMTPSTYAGHANYWTFSLAYTFQTNETADGTERFSVSDDRTVLYKPGKVVFATAGRISSLIIPGDATSVQDYSLISLEIDQVYYQNAIDIGSNAYKATINVIPEHVTLQNSVKEYYTIGFKGSVVAVYSEFPTRNTGNHFSNILNTDVLVIGGSETNSPYATVYGKVLTPDGYEWYKDGNSTPLPTPTTRAEGLATFVGGNHYYILSKTGVIPQVHDIYDTSDSTMKTGAQWYINPDTRVLSILYSQTGGGTDGTKHYIPDYSLSGSTSSAPWADFLKGTNHSGLNPGMVKVKYVFIGEGITSVGANAFYGGAEVTNISIPESVTKIGMGALEGTSISILQYPSNIVKLGYDPKDPEAEDHPQLMDSSTLNYVIVTSGGTSPYHASNGILYKGTVCIQCPDGLTGTPVIENATTEIADLAFSKSGISSIDLSGLGSLAKIGSEFLYDADNVISVTLPPALGQIGKNSITDCDSLQTLTLYDSIEDKTVDDWFSDNSSLIQFIVKGNSGTPVEYRFSVGLFGERSVYYLSDTPLEAVNGYYVTKSSSTGNIYTMNPLVADNLIPGTGIYYTVTDQGLLLLQWLDKSKSRDLTQWKYYSDGNYYPITTLENVPWNGSRSTITSISIGDGIGSIGNYAFSDLTRIERIDLPDSIQKIDHDAFIWTSSSEPVLEEVNVGKGLTSIGANAFKGQTALVNVGISDVAEHSIGNSAFEGCSSLEEYDLSNVTTIGAKSFYGANIRDVELTENITSVGEKAFSACANLCGLTISTDATIAQDAFDTDKLGVITFKAPQVSTIADNTWKLYSKLNMIIFEGATAEKPITCGADSFPSGSGTEWHENASSTIYVPKIPTSITTSVYYTRGGPDSWLDCGYDSTTPTVKSDDVKYLIAGSMVLISGQNESVSGNTVWTYGTTSDIAPWVTSKCSKAIVSNVAGISENMFYGSDLRSIEIVGASKNMDGFVIGKNAFNGSGTLKAIDLAGVTAIGESAFQGCSSFTTLDLPSSLVTTGKNAFKDTDIYFTVDGGTDRLYLYDSTHVPIFSEDSLVSYLSKTGEPEHDDGDVDGIDRGTKADLLRDVVMTSSIVTKMKSGQIKEIELNGNSLSFYSTRSMFTGTEPRFTANGADSYYSFSGGKWNHTDSYSEAVFISKGVVFTGGNEYSAKPYTPINYVLSLKATTFLLEKATVIDTAGDFEYDYTGLEVSPIVTASINGYTLSEGTNYTLTFEDRINTSSGSRVTLVSTGDVTHLWTKKVLVINKITLDITFPSTTIDYSMTPEYPDLVLGTTFVNNEGPGQENDITNDPSKFQMPVMDYQPIMPGSYKIVPIGGYARNYEFNYVPGTLTIDYVKGTIAYHEFASSTYAASQQSQTGVVQGSTVVLPQAKVLSVDGYTFIGWTAAVPDPLTTIVTTGPSMVPLTLYTPTITTEAPTIDLYAVYSASFVETVELYEWNGTAYGKTISIALSDGDVVDMPSAISKSVTATNPYLFQGWKAGAAPVSIGTDSPEYVAGDKYADTIDGASKTTTMYAVYSQAYTLKFYDTTPAEITAMTMIVIDGQIIDLPNFSVDSGMAFLGWSTANPATAETKVGTFGQKYTVSKDNLALYPLISKDVFSSGVVKWYKLNTTSGEYELQTITAGNEPFDFVYPKQVSAVNHGLMNISKKANSYAVTGIQAVAKDGVLGDDTVASIIDLDGVHWMISSVTSDFDLIVCYKELTDYGHSQFAVTGFAPGSHNNAVAVSLKASGDAGLAAGEVTVKGTVYTVDANGHLVFKSLEIAGEPIDVAAGTQEWTYTFTESDSAAYIYWAYAEYTYGDNTEVSVGILGPTMNLNLS